MAASLSIPSSTRRCTSIACTSASATASKSFVQGTVSPEKYLVPGARELVLALRERGLELYLASGTDQDYMREEARLLDIAPLFQRRLRRARRL